MAKETQDPRFVNRVIKQGNSLCIRIPSSVVKEIALKEGVEVSIEIHKLDYAKYQQYYEIDFLKSIENLPEIKKISDIKKKLFTALCFDSLKRSSDSDKKKEEANLKEILMEYKKELGNKLFDEYVKFGEIINTKVNIIEKDGSIVIRKGFR